jgi:hypothetical protein
LISGRKRWAFYPPDKLPPGLKTIILEADRSSVNDYRAFSPLRWYYEVRGRRREGEKEEGKRRVEEGEVGLLPARQTSARAQNNYFGGRQVLRERLQSFFSAEVVL